MAMIGSRNAPQGWLDRVQGPLAVIGALALAVAAGTALVAGEFSVPSRLAVAAGVLFLGMAVAIDPQKAWQGLTRREAVYGSNAVALSVAFIGILVVLNFAANRLYQRWDLTAQRDFSLSEATLTTINALPQPVHAMAFFSGGLADRQQAQDLLKEYEVRSGGKLTWEIFDTQAQPGIAATHGVTVDGTIQFRMGDQMKDTITPDESHMTTALIKLVNPTPVKVYYITGHGEVDLDKTEEEGYSELKTRIQADNFVVEELNLLAAGQVPEDAAAVIIAGAKSPYQEAELQAISTYLDGKGRLVLLVDPLRAESNVGGILSRWDLTLGNGLAVDPVSGLQQDPTVLIVGNYGLHRIVQNLPVTVMPVATSIQIPELIKVGVDISGLTLTADTRSWLESDTSTIRFDEGSDKKGPLTLGVAVEEVENPQPQEETLPGFEDPNKRVKNRAVILGSSEMAINAFIGQGFGNDDLFLNSLNWVVGTDQLITTRPVIEERRTLALTAPQANFVFYSSAIFLPLLLLGAGTVVWWMRR
ncbi:MAG: hypothetical protein GEU73_12755 [Chloroflexi bacterium]|nr:hypothetical protein [Chloroflexota bacterium]